MSYYYFFTPPAGDDLRDVHLRTRKPEDIPYFEHWTFVGGWCSEEAETHMIYRLSVSLLERARDVLSYAGFVFEPPTPYEIVKKRLAASSKPGAVVMSAK